MNVNPCFVELEETVLFKCNIALVNMTLICQLCCSTGWVQNASVWKLYRSVSNDSNVHLAILVR